MPRLRDKLQKRGCTLLVCGLNSQPGSLLFRSGFIDHLGDDNVCVDLTSALKRMDVAVYGALQELAEGSFQSGHRWLGASDGAVDITGMEYSRHLFKVSDLERIDKARDLLKAGKLKIPKQPSEVGEFRLPAL